MNIQNLYKSALVFASAIALVGCLEGESVPKPADNVQNISTVEIPAQIRSFNTLYSSIDSSLDGQINVSNLQNFGSGSTFAEIADGSRYPRTLRITSGGDFGVNVAFGAVFFESGFAEEFNALKIKVKNLSGDLQIKLFGEAGPQAESVAVVSLDSQENVLSVGDDWFEVVIPFSSFSRSENIPNHNGLLIESLNPNNEVFSFLFTDLKLVDYSSFLVSGSQSLKHLYSRDLNKDDASFYSLDNFGSGAVFEANHLTDPVFNRVFEVKSGQGYGAGVHVGFVASTALGVGFAADFNAIQLKVKNFPNGNLELKFIGGANDNRHVLNMNTFDGVVDLGEGWFEVTVPYSLFDRVGAENAFIDSNQNIEINSGLLIGPEGNQGQPFDFYFTDLKLLNIDFNN